MKTRSLSGGVEPRRSFLRLQHRGDLLKSRVETGSSPSPADTAVVILTHGRSEARSHRPPVAVWHLFPKALRRGLESLARCPLCAPVSPVAAGDFQGAQADRPVRSRRQGGWSLPEALEARILPATLVGANSVSYQDADGDTVTVTFSKSFLTPANVNSVFTFEGQTVNGSNAAPTFLRSINLTGIAAAALTTITTSANRNNALGGDGYASLGQINATGLDLGKVTIDGDLAKIDAGDANTTTAAIASLSVNSMGRFGTLTGASNLSSNINGKLPLLTVKTDVQNVYLLAAAAIAADGQFGTITIKGSLIGGAAAATGLLYASGSFGAVTIGGDIQGGGGNSSASLLSDGKIASLTVGGSIIGGGGVESAKIVGFTGLGPIKITGDVLGGSGNDSGQLFSNQAIGTVSIGGDLRGGAGLRSAQIASGTAQGLVTVTGSVVGAAEGSGWIKAGGTLAGATIGGSLVGGTGDQSGRVSSVLAMGAIKFTGSIIGGSAYQAGAVYSAQSISSAAVGGDVRGGSVFQSGYIWADTSVGTVTIGGSLIGGSGDDTGLVNVSTELASLTIGGSVIGSSGFASGTIRVYGTATTLTIKGSIIGGSLSGSGDLKFSGSVLAGRLGTMTLGGSLIAGVDSTTGSFHSNGAIRSLNEIASLTIKGSVIGNATNQAVISARGATSPTATSDVAIGKLTVNGRMERADVLAGVGLDLVFLDPFNANADAQMGTILINGDFIASNIVAGMTAGLDGKYGTADDVKMSGGGVKDVATVVSKITSLTIGGAIFGTTATNTDHFGIVAGNVGAFKSAARPSRC